MMRIDFRTKPTATPFEIEMDSGVTDVAFTTLSIDEAIEVGELQRPFMGSTNLTRGELTKALGLPKIVVSLKTLDGERVWDKPEDIEHISADMFFWLLDRYHAVNPTVVEGEDLSAKKNES